MSSLVGVKVPIELTRFVGGTTSVCGLDVSASIKAHPFLDLNGAENHTRRDCLTGCKSGVAVVSNKS